MTATAEDVQRRQGPATAEAIRQSEEYLAHRIRHALEEVAPGRAAEIETEEEQRREDLRTKIRLSPATGLRARREADGPEEIDEALDNVVAHRLHTRWQQRIHRLNRRAREAFHSVPAAGHDVEEEAVANLDEALIPQFRCLTARRLDRDPANRTIEQVHDRQVEPSREVRSADEPDRSPRAGGRSR